MSSPTYDAIVIGTGQGGKPLAKSLAKAGRKTAILERDSRVGGSCVLYGCTPTKTMVASARVAHLARRGADYGVHTGEIRVDVTRVRERKRAIVDLFSGGSQKGLERQDGLDLVFGEASFLDRNTLRVASKDGDEVQISASDVFINTGARPAVPDVPGLADVPFLTSTTIMELGEAPDHLVVMGGGYIGVEFGQMFRRFGSHVTIVQRGGALLSREDDDVSSEVAKILREDGIDVLLSSTVQNVARNGEGGTTVTVDTPEGSRELEASELLVAAGRIPNSDALALDAAGVDTDERGFIPVNERLETNVSGIYALGDVNGGPAFTHISYDDYRIIEANVLENGDRSTKGRLVPYVVFMDPEVARVGMSERDAERAGMDVAVAKLPMTHVARALESDETRGFMKAIVERGTDRILGCAIVGVNGGEVMSALQMAMLGDVPYTAIRDGVFAHPTLAESLNNLFMKLEA